jgi:NADH dehydrogenase (ubiquinone) flavoprotein 2
MLRRLSVSFLRRIQSQPFGNIQVNYTKDDSNTTSHIFNFTPENEAIIQKLLKKYPSNYKKSAVISVLFLAQTQNNNFLSLSAMKKVAEILECPEMDVYEVASFYTMFNRTRVGKFHLQICGTTPCMVSGSDDVIEVCLVSFLFNNSVL